MTKILPNSFAPSAPVGRLERRHFILGLAATGALVALPQPAVAAAPSYYGRGFQAGGYR